MNDRVELVIVGSVALDDIRTPSGEANQILGGSATYASSSAVHLVRPGIVAVVGDDFPTEHENSLRSRGISLEGLQKKPGRTFHWKGTYSGDMNTAETLETVLGVFEGFSPEIPDAYRECRSLFLGNIHPGLQARVLEQMDQAEITAADTMNYWITNTPADLAEMIRRVRIMFLNEGEIRQITGQANLCRAADRVFEMGPQVVVVKRGEHGASIHTRDYILFVPAYPTRSVYDPTGAGDSFAGGMMGYLAARREINRTTLREAAMRGTIMSSVCIEGFSPGKLLELARQEIDKRLELLAGMMGHQELEGNG